MKYAKPSIEISEAQAAQMLDGSQALAKENDAWDIWDEE